MCLITLSYITAKIVWTERILVTNQDICFPEKHLTEKKIGDDIFILYFDPLFNIFSCIYLKIIIKIIINKLLVFYVSSSDTFS